MGYLRREGMVVGNGLGVGRESRVSTRRRMAELTALSAYSDKPLPSSAVAEAA
jgi:hypothetical protein